MSRVCFPVGARLCPWTLRWSAKAVANDNGAGDGGLLDYREGRYVRV